MRFVRETDFVTIVMTTHKSMDICLIMVEINRSVMSEMSREMTPIPR